MIKVDLNIMDFFKTKLNRITADSFTWFGILILHGSLIPSMLAIMAGVTDKAPPLDLVIFIWGALIAFFIRSILLKDTLNLLTIGFGFIINAFLMAFIFFK
jgi:hypothetical protein